MPTQKNDLPAVPIHGSFTVERVYPQSPPRVFSAFSDQSVKRRWYAESHGVTVSEYSLDFRIGGREYSVVSLGGSAPIVNETFILDIEPDRRLIYAYRVTVGGASHSASLSTIEFLSEGAGTRLKFTEQDVFLTDTDNSTLRADGARQLLENLAAELARDN